MDKANKLLDVRDEEALGIVKSFSAELTGVVDLKGLLEVFNKYILYVWDYSQAFYLIKGIEGDHHLHYLESRNKQISQVDYDECRAKFELTANVNDQRLTPDEILVGPEQIGGRTLLQKKSLKNKKELVLLIEAGQRTIGYILLTGDSVEDFEKKVYLLESLSVSLAASIEKMRILIGSQHSKTESLIASLGDGVLVVNQEKEIVLSNKSFLEILNVQDGSEFSLANVNELVSRVNVIRKIEGVLQGGEVVRINEKKIVDRFFDISISPIKDHQSKISGASIIFHDISYLREIDELKSQFVTVASHKLRTPLTAIKLYTDMLVNGELAVNLQDEQKKCLDVINQSTERMSRLVNDLLNMSDIETGSLKTKLQDVDVTLVVKSVLAEMESIARLKKVKVEFQEKSIIRGQIRIDQNLLRQSIHSLVANAIEYSKEEVGLVEVNVGLSDENVEVKIVDNGIGIPDEAKNKMFSKFFRAENAQKINTEGSGLGLYVAQKIVESAGGQILFQSEEGQGAEFLIKMPIIIK